jgi:hypothetical protein
MMGHMGTLRRTLENIFHQVNVPPVLSFSCLAKVTPPRAQTLAGAADTARAFKKSDIDNYNALLFYLQWSYAPKIAVCHKTKLRLVKKATYFTSVPLHNPCFCFSWHCGIIR